MPIDPDILNVRPGDDGRLLEGAGPGTMRSFDLATPDTAPDEWKRAAARRVSANLGARPDGGVIGVPDPDGRVWNRGKPFATGGEYLDFMRGIFDSGNIWEQAATDELKAFEAADDAGRLALARAAQGRVEKAARAVGRLAPAGYGLPDAAPELTGAPPEVIEANARVRADIEARRRYAREQTARSEPFEGRRPAAEAAADRAALDAWRARREETELVKAHQAKLYDENLWAVWLGVAPALSDAGREIAEQAFKERKLSDRDIARFQRLDEKEQAVIARLARLSRAPAAGGFWNTLGDAGIGFVNGVATLPVNAVKQIDTLTTTIDQAVFGKDAGLVDNAEMNRRARAEQRLREALDDPAGIDPFTTEHGYVARSLIGAVSTLPYMGYASMGAPGFTSVALDFMQRLDDRIAQEGGDVHGRGPKWAAQKAVYGALYAGVEKLSALPVFRETGDIALKTAFLKLATRHGAAAAEKVALHIGKEGFKETLEESVQAVIEEHAASVGLGRGPGWREAAAAGVREFAETAGTMGLVSLVGAARQGAQARTLKSRERLADFVGGSLRREAFLLSDNPYAGKGGADAVGAGAAHAAAVLEGYRARWKQGGVRELERRGDLTPEQAAVLDSVFEGERAGREAADLILGRNLEARADADASGAVYEELDAARALEIVREAGPGAERRLRDMGFTEAGAARVADYFRRAEKLAGQWVRVVDDIRAALGRDFEGDPGLEAARETALGRLAGLQPLRDVYQRAGTRDGAIKAFKELKFTQGQAEKMADAFKAEHDHAVSPSAAAAFRAFYLDTSAEESAERRLGRMTGFEAAPAPERGDGAKRLTLRGADGAVRGSILYLPGSGEAFDPENPNAGEAVEQATRGRPWAVTEAQWKEWTPEARAAYAREHGISAPGGFSVSDPADPSVSADGGQAGILTGAITLAPDAPSATLYHEAAHAWLAVMRRAGKLSAADIAKLQARYGAAAGDPAWFNEEAFADDIREIGAETDYTPDKPLARRFIEAVRRFAGAAKADASRRTAASGARQALYENIVYGTPFEGVGDFAAVPETGAGAEAGAADPLGGAVTAKAATGDGERETGDGEQGTGDGEQGTGDGQPGNKARKPAAKKTGGAAPPAETDPKKRARVEWKATTPQRNYKVGGQWVIAPRDRFISDTDPRYDFSLQNRKRDDTASSDKQVAKIVTEFDAVRLMDSPTTDTGSPIAVPIKLKNEAGKEETYYMVLSGNGRFRALDLIDADHRGDEYRNPVQAFADERGIPYDPADMTEAARPRLVRVLLKRPPNITNRQIAQFSNKDVILPLTEAQQAHDDAALIEREGKANLYSANKDGLPSRNGSDEFFSWFVEATGADDMLDSKNVVTDAARDRGRRAMLALAIGRGALGKETAIAFLEQSSALGLERQRDALLMSAGALMAVGDVNPAYMLADEMSAAAASMLELARLRKSGRRVSTDDHIGQVDMFDEFSRTRAEIVRILDSGRPGEGMAEAFRRYADLASKIDTDTDDMFDDIDAKKSDLLAKAAADTDVKAPAGTRYSIALAARRYALATGMPAEGEKLMARQLEFLFARHMDPDYAESRARAVETRRRNAAEAERRRVESVRDAAAHAFNSPDNPVAWREAFDAGGGTVSRVVHQFFMPDGPARFPTEYRGRDIRGLRIASPADAAALLMPLRNPYQESMKAIFLDAENRVLGAEVCTVGLLNLTQVHPREMFKRGLETGAAKIIFAHNHPSGDPGPSPEDRDVTDRLAAAGRVLGIEYVDHIITDGDRFYSFAEASEIPFDGKPAAWDAVPGPAAPAVRDSDAASSFAAVLRQGGGRHVHAIMLDTKNRVTAVARVPFEEGRLDDARIRSEIFRAALSNPTRAVILDLTADGITPDEARATHSRIDAAAKITGVDLADTIYADGGWAVSMRGGRTGVALVPLKADAAAEPPAPRYSLAASADPAFAWMRDYYDESWGADMAGPERDARERLAREAAAVEAAHTRPDGTRKDSWMKAPNGKPTNLTARQWTQVRTPSFKAWFGDWENDPANASKILDANGEPLVVYHGTTAAGFAAFKDQRQKIGGDLGHYFSRRPLTAATYSGILKTVETPGEPEVDGNGRAREAYEGVYPVFLNIRDPREWDYNGGKWNQHPEGGLWYAGTRHANGSFFSAFKDDGSRAVFGSRAEAEAYAEAMPPSAVKGAERAVQRGRATTRELSERALAAGADGAVFRNVVDTGGFDVLDEDLNPVEDDAVSFGDDVYVAFSGFQIKSANANTGAFSPATDDIRYSLDAAAGAAADTMFDKAAAADAGSVRLVPVPRLIVTQAETADSVDSAERRMRAAAAGEEPRRAPVQAVENGDGTFDVVDGNATALAAGRMGIEAVWAETRARVPGGLTANTALFVAPRAGSGPRYATLDHLYRAAEKARPEFTRMLEAAAEAGGFTLHMRRAVKGRARAEQKLSEDYEGDTSRLLDALGGTFELEPGQRFGDAVKELESAGFGIVRIKNLFVKGMPPTGYRDVKVNVRTPDGFTGEVILIERELLEKKKGLGHDIYKEIRDAQVILEKAPEGNEKAAFGTLISVMERASAAYYGASGESYAGIEAAFAGAADALKAASLSTNDQATSSLRKGLMFSWAPQNILPGVLTRFPSMISNLRRLSSSSTSDTTPVSALYQKFPDRSLSIATPFPFEDKASIPRGSGKVNNEIRYSVQTRRLEPFALPDYLAEVSAGTSVSALAQTKFKAERARHRDLRDAQDWPAAESFARDLAADDRTRLIGNYLLAKYHGDAAAAKITVEKWAKPEEAEKIRARVGDTGLLKPIIFAPANLREGNRFNAIPRAYARWLAREIDGLVSAGFRKVDGTGAANTGAAMSDRVTRDYAFDGGEDIDGAAPVILVDDVWTSGQTLWTVYEHLKAVNPDAHVAAFATLASGRYGKNIRPTAKQLTAFWEKSKLSTISFKERAGNDIEKLTGSEIQAYILTGGRGPDAAAAFFGGGPRDGRGAGPRGVGSLGDGARPGQAGLLDVPVRYALDVTGRAYPKEDLLVGFMAHAALTGDAFPSAVTVSRLAERIGVESFNYDRLSEAARRLAEETTDEAVRKAAASSSPDQAAYAIGELARRAARAYVRSGAREGERLARSADRIRTLSEDGVRRAMQAVTGADYADVETDTDIDIAASILAADPKAFEPQKERERAEAAGALPETEADPDAQADPDPEAFIETDEDAPELTDKQRAEIRRKRREREARIQALLDAARERGAKNRFRDEERRRRKEAEEKAAAEEEPGEDAAGGAPGAAPGSQAAARAQAQDSAAPVDMTDRWEAAALLRVWAFDRFRRDNPLRQGETRDTSKDRVAAEFYRKTAVRTLTDLARKLLEPGAPRESVRAMIAEIVPGMSANQIERRTAHIFGALNRHAVREERRSLVKKFRAEIRRQFIKGAKFAELGIDHLNRALTGMVDEQARYLVKICSLSDLALDGAPSALQAEVNRVDGVLEQRANMTDADGEAIEVGKDDMESRRALWQKAMLHKYGGMADMMPGEIMDLAGRALAEFGQEALAVAKRWEVYDDTVKAILDNFVPAITRGIEDPAAAKSVWNAMADSQISMLRQRLDFLTRYEADPSRREAARAAISDFMDLLARGNTDYTVALADDRAALMGALGEIHAKPGGGPDRRRIRAYLRRLDKPIPRELAAQLTRQGHAKDMTHGQMVNLLGYLDQWATYKDNIIRHDRKHQAALIRSFRYEDPKTGEVVSAFTNEDAMLLEWLRRRFYAAKRGAISEVMIRLAGRPVDSPDPLYMPFVPLRESVQGLHIPSGGAWKAISGVFSRRVRHNLDIDESASILDVFNDRSHETALLTAFGERGLIIREVLTNRALQDAVRRFHGGKPALNRILRQVEQSLNGGRPRGGGRNAAAALAQRVSTYAYLGFNPHSAAKQTASLPVFAARLGFRKLGSILFSPISWDAVRDMRESDHHRARYGTGPAAGMNAADRAAYDAPDTDPFKRVFGDWGLWMTRKADWIISAWVGQGVYRDLMAKYEDQGMSEADAKIRAMSETWSLIEETQQSGRAENLPEMSREHGWAGRLMVQFATSPLQQSQYEIKPLAEWRDLVANGGSEQNIREARNRFMRALFINHVLVTGIMAAISNLYKVATGDEPDWKKEGFWWTLVIAAIMGQFGRIVFIGAMAEQTLRVLFLRKPFYGGHLVPAEGVIRFAGNLAYPVRDIVTWDTEHMQGDIMRMLKSVALTRLPVKVYENLQDKE